MQPLPLDCQAFYDADFLSNDEAKDLYSEIVAGFDVTNRVVKMADGTERIVGNTSHLFADPELTSFDRLHEVWGARSAWTESLVQVRDRIEAATGEHFRVAISNYYKDGTDYKGFHRDLPAFGPTRYIASLSLGAEREFVFRSVSNPADQYSIRMASGSLVFMGEGCQELYEHGVPVDEHCHEPRVNISFRKYGRTDQ
ncbi:MAG: alpha-ketoglutarate-dependent dioxygenase AlkB [Endozoicomonas sp.]